MSVDAINLPQLYNIMVSFRVIVFFFYCRSSITAVYFNYTFSVEILTFRPSQSNMMVSLSFISLWHLKISLFANVGTCNGAILIWKNSNPPYAMEAYWLCMTANSFHNLFVFSHPLLPTHKKHAMACPFWANIPFSRVFVQMTALSSEFEGHHLTIFCAISNGWRWEKSTAMAPAILMFESINDTRHIFIFRSSSRHSRSRV